MARAPSGRQHELRCGDHRVVVVEVGGGIREYEAFGHRVLDGYAAGEMADGGRGQLLVPWPNRIRDGRYRWEGREMQLTLSEPDKGNAIHGLARWVRWDTADASPSSVTLRLPLPPQPGYPFTVDLEVRYVLDSAGLTVTQTATNVGADACPYAAGCHPYIAAGSDSVDLLVLTVPARTRLTADPQSIPMGREPVAGEFDFRSPRTVGAGVLDTAFGDLEGDGDGACTVRVDGPQLAVELWLDQAHPYVMVFSGDTLAAPRRRRSLAVEPMTAAPDSFNSGDGLRRLEPGERFSSTWGIRPSLR